MKNKMVLLFMLLLFACDNYKESQPVEDLFIPEKYDASKIQGDVQHNWLESFEDHQLEELVKIALNNNKDLKASYYALRAAESEAKMSGALLYPSITLSATESRELFNSVKTSGSESQSNAFFDNFKGRRKNTGVSLNVSWELDLWGRLRAASSAAAEQYYASRNDFYASRLSLVAQVSKSYYALLASKDQWAIAVAIVDLQKNKVDFNKRYYDQGLQPSSNYRIALAELSSLEAEVEQRRRIYVQTQKQLEILLGHYPVARGLKGSQFPKLISSIPAGLPSTLLARRPDVLAAKNRLLAAGFKYKESKANMLPRFSMTASGGGRSHDFKYISNPSSRIWNLAGNLTQPLFELGRLREQVRLSEKQQQQVLAEYESLVLNAYAEVEIALAADEFLYKIENKRSKDMRLVMAIENEGQKKYSEGLQNSNVLIDSKKNTLVKKSLWIRAKRERLENRIDLHLALGGGWGDL